MERCDFLTLTYDDDHIPYGEILKRLQKHPKPNSEQARRTAISEASTESLQEANKILFGG